MRRRPSALLLFTAALISSCMTTDEPTESALVATAALQSAGGSLKGTARLTTIGDKVELAVTALGLTPGPHGTHLHTIGSCDPPDFKSAGGHLNPFGKMHGSENPQGSHLGDLSNLTVGEDGNGSLTLTLQGSLAELEPILFDADGTALVIHAAADDERTDPAGNAGPRIACGVLTRS